MNKVHVKKGDTVVGISGKDKKKKGKVLKVSPVESMVLVESVNIATKHKKPKGRAQQGGIIHQESPIHSSKVMIICPRCSEPTRIGKKFNNDGSKERICKKCDGSLD